MKLKGMLALFIVGLGALAVMGGYGQRSDGATTPTQDQRAASPRSGTTAKLATTDTPDPAAASATVERSSPGVDINDLLYEILSSTSPIDVLMKYLAKARDGDTIAQYRVATILRRCIFIDDSRAKTEALLRSTLEGSTKPNERVAIQDLIDRCSPIWQLPPGETGERADWLRLSAEAGFVPALLEAATDKAIEQTLEQRNAKALQALESRSAHVAAAVAFALHLDDVSPDGNYLERLPHTVGAMMRGLLASCALGDDCSMNSAAIKAYCKQTACPPAKDVIDLSSRQLSPAEFHEARTFADALLADLKAGRIRADVQPPEEDWSSYRIRYKRESGH